MPVSQLLAIFLYSEVKFSTVFHCFPQCFSALEWAPFTLPEPVSCLLWGTCFLFTLHLQGLDKQTAPITLPPPPFMFPCLNVVNFLLSPTRPLVICGYETVHFEKKTIMQCCGSGMFIPDPNFSLPNRGSRVKKIPDPGSDSASKNLSTFNPKNCF